MNSTNRTNRLRTRLPVAQSLFLNSQQRSQNQPAHLSRIDVARLIDTALDYVVQENDFGMKVDARGKQVTLTQPTNAMRKFRQSFPGCVVSYVARERAKCQAFEIGYSTNSLPDIILALLIIARMHWSRDVICEDTRRQFREYLPTYVQYESWPTLHGSSWAEAHKYLLAAFGLEPRKLTVRNVFL